MFIASNFLIALARVLGIVLNAYLWIVVIATALTWFDPDPWNPLVRFFRQATEPVLRPFRRFAVIGRMDLSPMLVILILIFLESFLGRTLVDFAERLR
jgi:YggT family protein